MNVAVREPPTLETYPRKRRDSGVGAHRHMRNHALLAAVLMVTAAFAASALWWSAEKADVRAGPAAPTRAPTATPGPPPPPAVSVFPTLERPLTMEEAIARAFEVDQHTASWKEPWWPATLAEEPTRLDAQWYPDRTYDGSTYPGDAERGPVWVITIRGSVHLTEDRPNKFHDGITYVIAQRTGNILSLSAGPWVNE